MSEKIDIVVSLKDTASKGVGKISKAFDKLKKNAKLVAIAGIGALSAMIVKTTRLFGVQEKAIVKMEAALKSSGQEVKNNSKDFQKFASELQKITTVGDEASLGLLQIATNMGLNSKQAKQATKDAIGLSKAFGIDTTAAIKAVTAAQLGDFNMLNRYIPALRSVKDETKKAAMARDLLNQSFKVAKAETATLAGATIQMQNAIGDAGEEIGKVFAPMLQKAAIFIRQLAERFQSLSPQAKNMVVTIGSIGVALIAIIPLLAVMAASMAAISWPVLAVVAAVALATVGFIKLSAAISDAGSVTNFLKNNFITLGQIVVSQIKRMLTELNKFLKILSKIPGVNINVDEAIANMDKLNAKMEEQKSTSGSEEDDEGELDAESEKEDARTEMLLQKEAERNAALEEQKAAQREENKAIMGKLAAIENEEELARFEEKLALKAEQGKLTTDQEMLIEQKRSELKKANWQKEAECNAALEEQKAAQREENKAIMDELAAIENEEELARFEEKLALKAGQGKLITDQEMLIEQKRSELKKANWQKDFGTWLGIEKLKRVNKKTTAQQMATWESFMLGATRSKNKDVAKIAKALAIKNIVFKTAEAAMSAFNAMAPIPFVGPVLGAAAAGAAIAFGAEQIATVQSQGTALAEGGIVAATPGGIQATIGEGGQDEAVVPLPDESDDEGGGRLGGDILVNVNIDGKPLVKEFYEIEQEMIRTGEIDTGGV